MALLDDFKPINNEAFITKERDILEKNKKFFSAKQKYVDTLLEIIDGRSDISIRVLDWLVSNYSKKNNTVYKIRLNGNDVWFLVNIEYKNQLNGYSKQYFDPFCRKKKVIYHYKSGDGKKDVSFVSSIGQLNFFQWAIRNKVIKYAQLHLNDIEIDMKKTASVIKRRKSERNQPINRVSISNCLPYIKNDLADQDICSSEKIASFCISPFFKQSASESKTKRSTLSKSIYDYGIKKTNMKMNLDFNG